MADNIRTEILSSLFESLDSLDNETYVALFDLLGKLFMVVREIHECMNKLYGTPLKTTVCKLIESHNIYLNLGRDAKVQEEFYANSMQQIANSGQNVCAEDLKNLHQDFFNACANFYSVVVEARLYEDTATDMFHVIQTKFVTTKLPELITNMCGLFSTPAGSR